MYDVGSYIDLGYLNTKRTVPASKKKTFQETILTAIKVSEDKYVFQAQEPDFKPVRHVPVVFA